MDDIFQHKKTKHPKWKRGKWLIKSSKVFDEDWFIFIVLSYLLNAAKLFLQKKEAEKNAWYTSLYKKNKKNKCRRKEQKWGKVKSDNDISQTHLQDKQNYRSKLKGKNCRFAHNWRIDIGLSSLFPLRKLVSLFVIKHVFRCGPQPPASSNIDYNE